MLENEKIISDEVEVANKMNTITVKNLKIPETFADHYIPYILSRHPTLNDILKYKDHTSIRVINNSQRFSSFHFSPVDKNTVF